MEQLFKLLRRHWVLAVGGLVLACCLCVSVPLAVIVLGSVAEALREPPNAVCPICGHKFHINYHRNQMARWYQDVRCPECGTRNVENMYLLRPADNQRESKP